MSKTAPQPPKIANYERAGTAPSQGKLANTANARSEGRVVVTRKTEGVVVLRYAPYEPSRHQDPSTIL